MDKLDKLLEKVDKQVKSKLEKLLSKLTEKQRRALLANPKLIDDLIKDFNADVIKKEYLYEFVYLSVVTSSIYGRYISPKDKLKAKTLLNILKNSKIELLGNALTYNKSKIKSAITDIIINKRDITQIPTISKEVSEIVGSTQKDVSNIIVKTAFENKPEFNEYCIWAVIINVTDNKMNDQILNTKEIFAAIPQQFWRDLAGQIKIMIRTDMMNAEAQQYIGQKIPTRNGARNYSLDYARLKARGMTDSKGNKIKEYANRIIADNTTRQVNMRLTGDTIEGLHLESIIENGIIMSYNPEDGDKIMWNENWGRVITTLNQKNRDKVLKLFSDQLDVSLRKWAAKSVTIHVG